MAEAASIQRQDDARPTVSSSEAARIVARTTSVDAVGLEGRAAALATRSIKRESKRWALDLVIRCMDLTTLEGTRHGRQDRGAVREGGAARSDATRGPVGGRRVPVPAARAGGRRAAAAAPGSPWPAWRARSRAGSARSTPGCGRSATWPRRAPTRSTSCLNRSLFLGGRYGEAFDELVAARGGGRRRASEGDPRDRRAGLLRPGPAGLVLAMAAGADFIKTSTGKIGVSATLPAALCMMEADPRLPPTRRAGASG